MVPTSVCLKFSSVQLGESLDSDTVDTNQFVGRTFVLSHHDQRDKSAPLHSV